MTTPRHCSRCGIHEDYAMLALRDGKLVCDECDSELENDWVAEDPENNRHFLDTFSPDISSRPLHQAYHPEDIEAALAQGKLEGQP